MGLSLDALSAALAGAVLGDAPRAAASDELSRVCVGLLGVDGAAVSMITDGVSQTTFGSSGTTSRRLDEYQFTYGEGPCLDAVASRAAVLVPDLACPREQRWPAYSAAVREQGFRGVFAVPLVIASVCVGALDLFRAEPGPLQLDQLAGARRAAAWAALLLVDLVDLEDPVGPVDLEGPDAAGTRAGAGDRIMTPERIEVHQATGMLAVQLDVSVAEALLRLRAHAISTAQTPSQVATDILAGRLRLERDGP